MRAVWCCLLALSLVGCAGTDSASTAEPVTTAPVTAVAATTTTTTTVAATVATTAAPTIPETTTTTAPDPVAVALEVAQTLATALASNDWATARRLAPEPVRTDSEFEDGFAGLDRATVYRAQSEQTADVVNLWLVELADETRASGPQTAAYCVHWAVNMTSGTVALVHGEAVGRFATGQDLDFLANAAAPACINFDGEASSGSPKEVDFSTFAQLDTTTTAQPVSPGPASPGPIIPSANEPDEPQLPFGFSQWLTVNGKDYACKRAGPGLGDLECRDYSGHFIGFETIYCSPEIGSSYSCNEDYYPSELDGFEISKIGFDTVLCRFSKCWVWRSGESPSDATIGLPDYECNLRECVPA